MHGVAFDIETRSGTLFFILDALVGGHLSFTVISSKPSGASTLSLHVLNFLANRLGGKRVRGTGGSDQVGFLLRCVKRIDPVALKKRWEKARAHHTSWPESGGITIATS
jgi:hypothetical protein